MALELLEHQATGARYLAGRSRAGLHDEMGVGKTATAIGAADLLHAERGMVICPAHLRSNWIGEFGKFSTRQRRIIRVRNVHDVLSWIRGRFHVMVLSYEQATKQADRILDAGEIIDFAALDEAHYLKNTEAKRTKAILGPNLNASLGAVQNACHVWHITGTPMPNDPADIYPFLRLTGATSLERDVFMNRYFEPFVTTYGVRMEPKPTMIAELKGIIEGCSIRRMLGDTGVKLPKIFLTSVLVDGDTDMVRRMISEHPGLEDAIVMAAEMGGLSSDFLTAQHIATLRRLVGEAKAVAYAHMLVEELLFTNKKRVVFGIHVDALATVRAILRQHNITAVIHNGQVSDKEKDEAVRAFQEDDACQVFIGNMRSSGTGLTLVSSYEIDILESDWSPAGNAQAIKRVHRIGQTQTVHGRFITLANSIDETVNYIVARKTAAIAQVESEAMVATPLDLASLFG